ncbi:hypothetical protein TKK_0011104 [Trichogramma kaykai]
MHESLGLNRLREDPNFFENVCFTDESSFTSSGVRNQQTQRRWAAENPHWIIERNHFPDFKESPCSQADDARTILALDARKVLALELDDVRTILSLDARRVFAFKLEIRELVRVALPRLLEIRPNAWWQQDGAPSHGCIAAGAVLNRTFQDRWIGKDGPASWPSKSPDLNVCDFGLWADLKKRVHARGPSTDVTQIIEFIEEECRQYPRKSIRKATATIKRRLTLCLEEEGGHFQQFLKTRRGRDDN